MLVYICIFITPNYDILGNVWHIHSFSADRFFKYKVNSSVRKIYIIYIKHLVDIKGVLNVSVLPLSKDTVVVNGRQCYYFNSRSL